MSSCEKLIFLLDKQVDRLEPHFQSLIGSIGDMQVAQQEILKQLEARYANLRVKTEMPLTRNGG